MCCSRLGAEAHLISRQVLGTRRGGSSLASRPSDRSERTVVGQNGTFFRCSPSSLHKHALSCIFFHNSFHHCFRKCRESLRQHFNSGEPGVAKNLSKYHYHHETVHPSIQGKPLEQHPTSSIRSSVHRDQSGLKRDDAGPDSAT